MAYTINKVMVLSNGSYGVDVTFDSGKQGIAEFPNTSTATDITTGLTAMAAAEVKVYDPTSKLSAGIKALVGFKG